MIGIPIAKAVEHVYGAKLAASDPHSATLHYVLLHFLAMNPSIDCYSQSRTGRQPDRSESQDVMKGPQIADPSTVPSISPQEQFSYCAGPLHRRW